MGAAIYFTTDAPRECNNERGRDFDALCEPDHHAHSCPACCGEITWVDRFGEVLDANARQARRMAHGRMRDPIAHVVCRRTYDHDGECTGVSPLGGYTVRW